MEKRDDALREAIDTNAQEIERWQTYKSENEKAIENLDKFSKHLTVDVMVPIGKKAFMPGQLIHTNEVLVGHYQGYFSECSAHQAKEMCKQRLRTVEEQLKKLEVEAELWQNKLNAPILSGAMPNSDVQEIVEDYDEEKEKLWRSEHINKVKAFKQRERESRGLKVENEEIINNTVITDEAFNEMIEEAELLEELKDEFNSVEMDNVDIRTVHQLMAGEMKLPKNRSRIAHNRIDPKVETKPIESDNDVQHEKLNELEPVPNEVIDFDLPGVIKRKELTTNEKATNNNYTPNPEITLPNDDEIDADSGDDDTITDEMRRIKRHARLLSLEDRIDFYENYIKIYQAEANILLTEQIDEKIQIYLTISNLREELGTTIEEMMEEETKDSAAATEQAKNQSNEQKALSCDKTEAGKKRRISFALSEETIEFRPNETVAEMMPKPERDIITLDEPIIPKTVQSIKQIDREEKRQNILKRVEQNLEHVVENQSVKDFDLINQILEVSTGRMNTLFIKFQHSDAKSDKERAEINGMVEVDTTPASPADFYEIYQKCRESTTNSTVYVNGYEGEDQVKTPILTEAKRQMLYENPKRAYSIPGGLIDANATTDANTKTKSILRNRNAVDNECRNPIVDAHVKKLMKKKTKQKMIPSTIDDELENMSTYFKVVHDVVEKKYTEPDPLPNERFIDAHSPKKRISRFKQQRSGAD